VPPVAGGVAGGLDEATAGRDAAALPEGDRARLEKEREAFSAAAEVVARFRHSVRSNRGGGYESTCVLYSDGSMAEHPASGLVSRVNEWSLSPGVLTLRWKRADAPGGYWVDTCALTPDGTRYAGTNQLGNARVEGVRVARSAELP
jgi:hypothetical protein